MNSDFTQYDIVIIPPPEIAEQAIVLSQALKPLGSCFVLDGVRLFPHISLYHVPFDPAALERVIQALESISGATQPFLLRQALYYPDQGIWVGVRFEPDKGILDLHTTVIDRTREYRETEASTQYKERETELLPREYKNIEYCGWAHSFTLYSPHLTFTRLRQPRSDVLVHLSQPEFSFQVDRIGLFELGRHGTCIRQVADFQLTGR